MVMKKMREHTKTFLIILVAAFIGTIIFDWGMNVTGLRRSNDVGEVNGEKITYEQYYRTLRNAIDSRRQQDNGDISDSEMNQLEDQVWETMVQQILMRQEIERRGITASDSEVVAVLKYNPPMELRQNESFQTDGSFDIEKYRAALRDPRNDWRPVEEYVRTVIPFQKLQQQITASVLITPQDVRWEYLKRNEKVKVKYIFFNLNDIPNDKVTLSEKEIEAYYNKNKETFHQEEQRKIEYAMYPIKPTANDSQAVWDDALDLIERIKSGEDFASVAESYSEDPGTREKGGDLGYFPKGNMVKPFEEAAFSAKVGEIVGPVKSSFGLHIIKVEDKRVENGEEQIRARHILLKYTPSNQTISNIRTNATLFAMDAIEMGFDTAAKKDSVDAQESPLFGRGGFIPGIGISRDITEYVFKGELGDIREEPFETDRGFFVVKISDIQKEHIKPLEEVQTTIRSTLLKDKKKELVRQQAAQVRSKMTLNDDFEKIAKQDSLNIKETDFFTRNGSVPQVGREPNFIGTAFSLKKDEISAPVETTRGYYLVKMVDHVPIDEAAFEKQKESIYKELLSRQKQQAFVEWFNNLKKNANIKDNRQRNT